jgi:Rod binding domain-containing protein
VFTTDFFSSGLATNATTVWAHSGTVRQIPSTAISPADSKLRKAAGEFESLLLSNLWKSMKSTFADPDVDSEDPAHDTLEDWGIDAMSGAVGKAGGLGLGKLILKHLEPALFHSQGENGQQSGKDFAPPADIPP